MPNIERDYYNLFDLVLCLTNAVDLISPEVADHHQKVAYLAYRIAEHLDLPINQKRDLVLAGLLHDVGALSLDERLELIENEPITSENHAVIGARLVENFAPLKRAGEIIRYHHVPWNYGEGRTYKGNSVPILSHILHLADRIAVQTGNHRDIISQTSSIRDSINKQRDSVFMPELVDAFMDISVHEYLWLDIVYKPLVYTLPDVLAVDSMKLSLDKVIDLTKIFANIIDFRSPFTANHSAGVAKTAEKLAELAGFSENERKMMIIAGNLHDLGKLGVSRSILEKPDKLTPSEFDVIKSHTFFTYRLLQPIKGFETINKWASFHHEKLNGEGYPFHLDGGSIPLGSRIITVADIFTAITEDRPYRKGMTDDEAKAVLGQMVCDNYICSHAVTLLLDNFDTLCDIRKEAQEKASLDYNYIVNTKE